MRKNAEKMDLSSRNRLLRVPAGSHGFWAHDPLPDPSHDPDVDPRRVTIPLAFTNSHPSLQERGSTKTTKICATNCQEKYKKISSMCMSPLQP